MLKELKTFNLNEIEYEFIVDTVNVTDIEGFSNVVTEIRCFYRGTIGEETKNRYYVHNLNPSNISPETFIDINDITKADLVKWLEDSVDANNLANLKRNVQELFNPPSRNISITFFK
jgi:hypothetical protein